jgi:YD repeat-containing protein
MKTLILSSVVAALTVTAAYAQPASPLPAPAAKVHTRAEVQAHVAQMFARLDTNRDGSVTQAEADAARGQWIEKRRERAAERGGAAFDRLDTNKDGQVSRQEWDAGRQVREQRMAAGGQMRGIHHAGMGFGGRMFGMADANKDGRVSLAEAQAAALQHFDRVDLNHDGKITPDERRQVHRRPVALEQG